MSNTINEKVKSIKVKVAQLYLSMKSEETPWLAKVVGVITITYALSPIDLIPDFIPILGYLDDIIILPLFIWLYIKLIPKTIWESYEEEAITIWTNSKPTKWYYAIPIIAIWLLVIGIIYWILFRR